jgi:hypothetical protein
MGERLIHYTKSSAPGVKCPDTSPTCNKAEEPSSASDITLSGSYLDSVDRDSDSDD